MITLMLGILFSFSKPSLDSTSSIIPFVIDYLETTYNDWGLGKINKEQIAISKYDDKVFANTILYRCRYLGMDPALSFVVAKNDDIDVLNNYISNQEDSLLNIAFLRKFNELLEKEDSMFAGNEKYVETLLGIYNVASGVIFAENIEEIRKNESIKIEVLNVDQMYNEDDEFYYCIFVGEDSPNIYHIRSKLVDKSLLIDWVIIGRVEGKIRI